jgi:hypothetical protein
MRGGMGMKKFVFIFIILNGYCLSQSMEKHKQEPSYFTIDQLNDVSYCNPEIVDRFSELSNISIPHATPFVSVKISKKSLVEEHLLILVEKYGIPLPFLYKKQFILHDTKYQYYFERGPDSTDSKLKWLEWNFMMVPLITAALNCKNIDNKVTGKKELLFEPDLIKLIKNLVEKNILKKIADDTYLHLQYEHGKKGWLKNKQKIVQKMYQDIYVSNRLKNYICTNASVDGIENLILYKRK